MSCQPLQLAEVDAVASEIVVCVACSRILVCYRDEKACVFCWLARLWSGGAGDSLANFAPCANMFGRCGHRLSLESAGGL